MALMLNNVLDIDDVGVTFFEDGLQGILEHILRHATRDMPATWQSTPHPPQTPHPPPGTRPATGQ
jgi:hypothetical protein